MNENQNEYVDINAHDNYPDSEQTIEIPTMKVIPLKKICMTIGELPTAYLETMSYYEMLIWFIEYLKNNIIPTINNNASAIQEVQSVVLALQNYINDYKDSIDSDVEELETYMNNYFENLDVQEEINNKLDDMLEDGDLMSLLSSYIPIIYPEMFGAVGDGETDDTTAIQTAINTANSTKGQLNFMDKTYLVSDSLTLYSGLYIEGNNATLKILVNKPLFISEVISNLHINNLRLVGANNSEYTNNIGMKLVCFYSKFTNMRISSFYQGIYLDTTGATGTLVENIFDTITFSNCNMSFYGGIIGNNKITDGYLTNIVVNNADSTQTAVAIGSGAGWVVKNIHIYGSCNNGLSVLNCFYTTIDSIYVENALSYLLNLSIQNSVELSNISGRLRHSGNIGIRLDRTSYHSDITSANISNVYLSVEAEATSSYGIRDISTALKLNISNFTESVSESVTNYTKISGTNPNYIGNAYITERLYTDTSGVLNYRDSKVGLSYKHSFSGSSEITLQIPLNNNVYSYSMSKINMYMISKQNWNGSTSINYSVNLIMIDKGGTKSFAKVNESGNDTGFTTAPTFTYNSNTKTIDVTFTPSGGYNGFLFADII